MQMYSTPRHATPRPTPRPPPLLLTASQPPPPTHTCHIAAGCAWRRLELAVLQMRLPRRGHQAVCKGDKGVLCAVTCVRLVLVTALREKN